MRFSDLKLSEKTIKALEDIGYTEATEIQEKAIPEIQKGSDLIGLSQTGTGKTAAFGIPTLENVLNATQSSFNLGKCAYKK